MGLFINGFPQICGGTQPHRLLLHPRAILAGEGHLNPGGEQLFLKFKAADAGQSDIQEQTNRAASEIRLAKLSASANVITRY